MSTLHGADGRGAVLYDSGNGWPVGPVWDGVEAVEQAEAFLGWVTSGRWIDHMSTILANDPHMLFKVVLGGDTNDPRSYSDRGVAVMIQVWSSLYVDDEGWLIDTQECVCGEGHHHDKDGCLQCDCDTFVPSTEAGRIEAAWQTK